MKRILTLLMVFCSLAAMGQYPVSSISITMPPNPAANTGDWAMPFVITAQAKLVQGQVPGNLMESRILVTVKEAMLKKCGSYTQQTAPMSNFNTATKSWSGAAAVGLLGNGCTLKPGTYELCVQFFSGYAPVIPLSNEVCKSFTIADTKQQSYSPPQNIMPANGKVFTEQEAGMPIMLRWTPVVPKPQGDVLYKVRLIEILPGQNKTEALRINTPIDILEVKNNTQTSYKLSKRITGLYWEVEAESAERVQGEKPRNYGKSEATNIAFKKSDEDAKLKELSFTAPKNITPVDGKVFTKEEGDQPIRFTWAPVTPTPKEGVLYKVRVVEIKKGQPRAEALRTNTPTEIFEVKNSTQTTAKLSKRCNNCEYIWDVTAVGTQRVQGEAPKSYGSSEATSFSISQPECHLEFPRNIRDSFIVICKGTDPATGYNKYNVCTWLYNKNDLTSNPLTVTNLTSIILGNTISNVSPPFSFSIPAGGRVALCFDITVPPTQTHINVKAFSNFIGSGGEDCSSNPVSDSIPLVPCVCNYCKDNMWSLQAPPPPTETGGILTIAQTLSINTTTIKAIKAEIISFIDQPSNELCIICNRNSSTYGNFETATLNGVGWPMTNGVLPNDPSTGLNTHHTISWWNNTATTFSNGQFRFRITLPPANSLSCCCERFRICIRYTFINKDCQSCSVVQCYGYTRNPRACNLQTGEQNQFNNEINPMNIKVENGKSIITNPKTNENEN